MFSAHAVNGSRSNAARRSRNDGKCVMLLVHGYRFECSMFNVQYPMFSSVECVVSQSYIRWNKGFSSLLTMTARDDGNKHTTGHLVHVLLYCHAFWGQSQFSRGRHFKSTSAQSSMMNESGIFNR